LLPGHDLIVKPWSKAVIYRTHKGRGVSFMEDTALWHGAVVDDQTYAKARPELLETLEKLEAML
jgi:transketolase